MLYGQILRYCIKWCWAWKKTSRLKHKFTFETIFEKLKCYQISRKKCNTQSYSVNHNFKIKESVFVFPKFGQGVKWASV